MTKDLFAQAAGFQVIKGQHALTSGGTDGPWGLDDRTLLEQTLDDLRAHAGERTFTTVLTSGTHPPYQTPESNNDKASAFAFASKSVGWFVEQLRSDGLMDETLLLVASDESSAIRPAAASDPMPIPPANHGYLLALGAGLTADEQLALFGQVDVAASVLDVLDLPRAGFGGASVFRRLSGERTLLAADAYKKAIYAVSEQSVVRCDQALTCFDAEGTVIDPAGIRALLARNELRRVDDSPLLAQMPARDYAADQANMLLGRYLTHVPRGQGLVLRVSADNSDGAARLFRLMAWDCSGRYRQRVQQQAVMPAGEGLRVRFALPQLFEQQCLRLQALPSSPSATGTWHLQGLSVAVDTDLERTVATIRQSRASAELDSGAALPPAIAHAGGALNGRTYTNAIAALEQHYARGVRWFELDFQWTADGHLVCGHDWGPTLPAVLRRADDAPPTLVQFEQATAGETHLPCTLVQLRDWLQSRPDARIVTDLKLRALDGLAILGEQIPNHAQRLVAQVYEPQQLAQARALGYADILWTLYRYPGDTPQVLAALTNITPLAVTMDQKRLAQGLGLVLQRAGVPVYVHTVNDAQIAAESVANWGAVGVYSDILAADDAGDAGVVAWE